MNMDIKITVTNHFTKEVIIDSTTKGITGGWATVEKNHKTFSQAYPDCYVNMVAVDGSDGIWGMPYNQEQDELALENGQMTFGAYCKKWYQADLDNWNDEIPEEEVERQIDMLLEQDWDERDSVCH